MPDSDCLGVFLKVWQWTDLLEEVEVKKRGHVFHICTFLQKELKPKLTISVVFSYLPQFSYNTTELELPLLLLSHCPWPQEASPAAWDIWPPAERAVVSGGRWWELRGSELPGGIRAHVLFLMQGAELAELSDSQPCGRAGQDDSCERFPSFTALWP